MLSESSVACPGCKVTLSLKQGAAEGMRCGTCGRMLEQVDARWTTGERKRGAQPDVARAAAAGYRLAELQLPAHNEVDEEHHPGKASCKARVRVQKSSRDSWRLHPNRLRRQRVGQALVPGATLARPAECSCLQKHSGLTWARRRPNGCEG